MKFPYRPVAQWITRLPTEQKIAGSIPAWIDYFICKQCVEKIFRIERSR